MSSNYAKGRLAWIDGLRAIAVLSVLCYHFEIDLFSQGLLGVDMFFVISGFVVCKSLQGTLARSDHSFYEFISLFYKRRVWRLMPALIVMVLVTTAFCFLLPPAYLGAQIAFTGAAALGGFANIVLMLGERTNYFDQMAGYNPFLHTWSLGVEEQFYLVFPLLIWGIWRAKGSDKLLICVLSVLSVISLGLAVWWSTANSSVAFYSLFSRFWELAAGAIAYMATRSAKLDEAIGDRVRSFVSSIAFILILASLFQPGSLTSPVPAAFLTVAASAIFMWSNSRKEGQATATTALLTQAAVTYIGRISYSLYLWHWPVVVLMRWTVGFEGIEMILSAFTLSFLLGIASYHLIETPTQSVGERFSSVRPEIFAPLMLLVFGYVGAVLFVGSSRSYQYYMPSLSAASADGWSPRRLPTLGEQPSGGYPMLGPKLLVVGDSHAGALSGAAILAAKNEKMGYQTFGDCGFKLLTPLPNAERCAFLKVVQPGDVVLFSALNLPRFVNQDGTELPAYHPDSVRNTELREKAFAQFDAMVAELRSKGVGVILRGPEPLFRYIPFRCADRYTQANPICDNSPEMSREEIVERARPVQAGFEHTAKTIDGVILMDVIDTLCQEDVCSIFDRSGNPLFTDQDHLSGWGNEALLPVLQKSLSAAREVLAAKI